MKKPKKWSEIYPQGTKEGDEEQKFFIALARSKDSIYRSTSTIVQETGLPPERVEEIIDKYMKLGIIYPHAENSDHWVYWERDLEVIKVKKSISQTDKENRIKKYLDRE